MKPFKAIYMIYYENSIIFPKDVQYLDDGYYICTDSLNNKYCVKESNVSKLFQNDFDRLIRGIHRAIYDGYTQLIWINNIIGVPICLYVHPNGNICNVNYRCTLFVPRNCLKWDNSLLKAYYRDSYILVPCDKYGKEIIKAKSEINPYTNNCNIVYKLVSDNPGISTSELIDLLQWPPNSVTSRISELTSGGRICSIGRVLNPKTGRNVHKWATMDYMENGMHVI